jgi:hypothetical protein
MPAPDLVGIASEAEIERIWREHVAQSSPVKQ